MVRDLLTTERTVVNTPLLMGTPEFLNRSRRGVESGTGVTLLKRLTGAATALVSFRYWNHLKGRLVYPGRGNTGLSFGLEAQHQQTFGPDVRWLWLVSCDALPLKATGGITRGAVLPRGGVRSMLLISQKPNGKMDGDVQW